MPEQQGAGQKEHQGSCSSENTDRTHPLLVLSPGCQNPSSFLPENCLQTKGLSGYST